MNGTYEFYAPFAHIPGRYEVARIHTTTHGSFDTFIVITTTTDRPVTVYVNSDAGEQFMADRYPESTAVRVGAEDLVITESPDGELVRVVLAAVDLTFRRVGSDPPVAAPYGGEGFAVWGSTYTCTGVDMEVPAVVNGHVALPAQEPLAPASPAVEHLSDKPGVITRGSYGYINPL
ncbi:MAG: hypothetical protein PF508_21445 [Spirochaeta sp.]|jgi:hypothetical protein|nr:hypothetical protein [Spirochaeta sp.]